MFVEKHGDDGRGGGDVAGPGEPDHSRQCFKTESRNMKCFHVEVSSWKSKRSHFVNIKRCERLVRVERDSGADRTFSAA